MFKCASCKLPINVNPKDIGPDSVYYCSKECSEFVPTSSNAIREFGDVPETRVYLDTATNRANVVWIDGFGENKRVRIINIPTQFSASVQVRSTSQQLKSVSRFNSRLLQSVWSPKWPRTNSIVTSTFLSQTGTSPTTTIKGVPISENTMLTADGALVVLSETPSYSSLNTPNLDVILQNEGSAAVVEIEGEHDYVLSYTEELVRSDIVYEFIFGIDGKLKSKNGSVDVERTNPQVDWKNATITITTSTKPVPIYRKLERFESMTAASSSPPSPTADISSDIDTLSPLTLSTQISFCGDHLHHSIFDEQLSSVIVAELLNVCSNNQIFRELSLQSSVYEKSIRSGEVRVFIDNESLGTGRVRQLSRKETDRIKLVQRHDITIKRLEQKEHEVATQTKKSLVSEVELEFFNATSQDESIELREQIGETSRKVFDYKSLSPWKITALIESDNSTRYAYKTIFVKSRSSLKLEYRLESELF